MVYYEEAKLINNWQLDRVLVLSSAGAPSVEKRRENGELKNRGREGGALNFSSPHSPAYRNNERELCGGESSFSAFLVQQQNTPLYFSFLSQAVSYILVTQFTTLNFTESPET